jgi:hypothetical protein
MTRKKRIRIREFVQDIWSGLSNLQLMEKHRLSPRELRRAFEKLIDLEGVDFTALYRPPIHPEINISDACSRKTERHNIAFRVPIYEPHSPDVQGAVRNISDQGIGISGIEATPGEIKSFVIESKHPAGIEQIQLHAECRWTDTDSTTSEPVGGFRMTRITRRNRIELQRLVEFVSVRS